MYLTLLFQVVFVALKCIFLPSSFNIKKKEPGTGASRRYDYYTDLSIWWEKWPLLLRQMPTRDAVLFWALWAIMWEKCPLLLRQMPTHDAVLFWALWAIMWEKCPLLLRQMPTSVAEPTAIIAPIAGLSCLPAWVCKPTVLHYIFL